MTINLVGSVIEGGQTWAHRVRMVRQVVLIAAYLGMGVTILLFGFHMYQENNLLHKAAWNYAKAEFFLGTTDTLQVDADYWARVTHQQHHTSSVALPVEKVIAISKPGAEKWWEAAKANLSRASKAGLTAALVSFLFFAFRGRASKRKRHLSGKRVLPWWRVALKLKVSRRASSLHLGRLPLVRGTETQHILVSGGTGSGKTNCYHTLLPQIRRLGHRAVVVDLTGEFIGRYYRPGKDILLNPFDERTARWLPWAECSNSYDFDSLAESFIPSSNCERDGYWRTAAQSVLSAVLSKSQHARRIGPATQILLCDSLADLCQFVQGTKAGAHLDLNSEKTAGSIRSVASTYVQSFETLVETDQPFSIRDWVAKSSDDSWLFLSSTLAQRSTLRPMISAWLSIAIRSLLQLQPDLRRRLWFIIDELPALQKVKDLETFVSESRKFGGCGLFAIQSPAQLEMIYGWESARIILGNCLTKAVFYEQDPEIAAKLSKAFGEREIREFQEGISYGSHQMRDGVNLSSQIKNIPTVTATDIQSLRVHEALVKLPGKLPACRVRVPLVR